MHLQTHKDFTLKFPKLYMNSLKIISYSDASLRTNHDHTSQICYVIILADKHNDRQPFYCTS